ncbi:MAG: nucleotidyltransferase domain-containing protein [bacterium]
MVIKVERKKLNKQELKETVGIFKKKLEKENIPFEKVYVFGSYAKGKQKEDSDIDIAVVVPSGLRQEQKDKLSQVAWWAKEINLKIESHILTTKELNNRWLSFPAEIRKFGLLF